MPKNSYKKQGPTLHKLMPGSVIAETSKGTFQIGAPFDAFKRMLILTKEKNIPTPYCLIAPDDTNMFGMALWAPEFYVLHHLFLFGAAFNKTLQPSKVRFFINKHMRQLSLDSLRDSILGPDARSMRSWRRDGKRVVHTREIEFIESVSKAMAIKDANGSVVPVEDFVEIRDLMPGEPAEIFPGVVLTPLGSNKYKITDEGESVEVDVSVSGVVPPMFEMPAPKAPIPRETLGVVPLGNRSGFSTTGPNTGFLIWVNGHPVIFDGPYGSVQYLAALGVHESEIKAIIVSHVHEDHIGALVELVLLPQRPMLITTEPIYRCVVTKLALYLNRPMADAAKYVNFSPVYPGHPRRLFGANFNFFYTIHPIPTVGVKISLPKADGVSGQLVISGDNYTFAGINKLLENGVIGKGVHKRISELAPLQKQDNSLYFIDAGQSSIHGDDSEYKNNPNKIIFYHVDKLTGRNSPEHELAQLGRLYTVVPSTQIYPIMYEKLFEALHLGKLKEKSWVTTLISSSRVRQFSSGSTIIEQGERLEGDECFYVVLSGIASVYVEDKISKTQKRVADLGAGEFFGEISILTGQERTATIKASSPVELFEIPGDIFSQFVESNNLLPNFKKIWENRSKLEKASLFRSLNVRARNLISLSSVTHKRNKGEEFKIANKNDFYFVNCGSVVIRNKDGSSHTLKCTDQEPFFGLFTDFDAPKIKHSRIEAGEDNTQILEVQGERFRRLYDEAPVFRYQVALSLNPHEEKDKSANIPKSEKAERCCAKRKNSC